MIQSARHSTFPLPVHLSEPVSAIGPLLLWLLIQLVALFVPAVGWRYAASERFPDPPEQLAAHVMVTTQLAASALLFPYLLRSARAAIGVVATSWPITLLSQTLAGQSYPLPVVATLIYVTGWLIALAMIRRALNDRRALQLSSGLITAWVLGAAALEYLATEFGESGAGQAEFWVPRSSPIREAMQLGRLQESLLSVPIVLLGILAASGIILVISVIVHRLRPTPREPSSIPPN